MTGDLLYQLDARVTLRALSDQLGRPATLDDIPDERLDALAARGFSWLYLLGVWQTGWAGPLVSRSVPAWRDGYRRILPDLEERDICGSCFAVTGYDAAAAFGGNAALARLRARLARRGLRLMLDFVPNHVALDHPWVATRPELLMHGTPASLAAIPGNYVELEAGIFAHGRDPNFPGWPDTLQLDYAAAETIAAMMDALQGAASHCDGLRCDMAMLLLPEIFERTWGETALPFWAEAITRVRARAPAFIFMAEVYWGLESEMLRLGFDLAYDKTLYDRLAIGDASGVRAHLGAARAHQDHLARFLENHDEPRAAATFPGDRHRAAALLTFCGPGLRFFHDGQLDGREKTGSVHLDRIPDEPPDPAVAGFYDQLLAALGAPVFHAGTWTVLPSREAWEGNWTNAGLIAMSWTSGEERRLVVVNLQANQAQAYVRLSLEDAAGTELRLADCLSPACYDRSGDDLLGRGLYLDLPPWGVHLFEVTTLLKELGEQP